MKIQWWPKLLKHKCFHQLKNFNLVIYIFCCSVSVGNISLHRADSRLLGALCKTVSTGGGGVFEWL